ncbi:hypothetical protein SAMN05216327_109224 [Dyadobacter sp. SG02]|nr:hypothetical protein SAMN05216327_109224 [Dyadobacter sp. SG02]
MPEFLNNPLPGPLHFPTKRAQWMSIIDDFYEGGLIIDFSHNFFLIGDFKKLLYKPFFGVFDFKFTPMDDPHLQKSSLVEDSLHPESLT